MKFLFVSYEGLIADIAWQVVKEGHEAKMWIQDPALQEIANGLVPKTKDWKKELDWADTVVFDDVLGGMGTLAEELRRAAKPVVGGSSYSDRLEEDRAFGQNELKSAGVSIIPQENFAAFDDAIAYVQAHPNRYVIKPSGEAQNIKRLLFVGEEEDGRDVVQVLTDYKQHLAATVKDFQLQRRIIGVEVAIGAFFTGGAFVTPVCVNFEHKKLFPGDIGPSTGEMGTTMFWSGPNRLFNATLKRMESRLAEAGYSGYIDINCIVNSNGIYPLEFTSRFGYPGISIQQEGLLTPMGEVLQRLGDGTLKQVRPRSGFQIGVRVVVPPFPYHDMATFESMSKDSVVLFKTPNRDGIHIEDVKLVSGEWRVTGNSGVVLVVCGTGPTMKQAQRQAYNRVRNVMIPYMYYRDDIGERWTEDSDRLHAWGYLREA
ncbi:MAG: phosphoribosylglycinamide synthetase C domain-containing protein [Burkholderiales bacterium]